MPGTPARPWGPWIPWGPFAPRGPWAPWGPRCGAPVVKVTRLQPFLQRLLDPANRIVPLFGLCRFTQTFAVEAAPAELVLRTAIRATDPVRARASQRSRDLEVEIGWLRLIFWRSARAKQKRRVLGIIRDSGPTYTTDMDQADESIADGRISCSGPSWNALQPRPPDLFARFAPRHQHQALELGDQDSVLVENPGVNLDDAAVGL